MPSTPGQFAPSVAGQKVIAVTEYPYLTAIVQTYIDSDDGEVSEICDTDSWILQPAGSGLLIASVDNEDRVSELPEGDYTLEVRGTHEGAWCDHTIYCVEERGISEAFIPFSKGAEMAAAETSTSGSHAATPEQELVRRAKLRTIHSQVESNFDISSEYLYYPYRDDTMIISGSVAPFVGDQDAAWACLMAIRHVELEQLQPGDTAPGYWIHRHGTQAIVGTRKADGSLVAYRISLVPDKKSPTGYGWGNSTELTR